MANQPAVTGLSDAPETVLQSALQSLPIWLRKCEQEHGAACRPVMSDSSEKATPRFLIDLTGDGRIVRTTEGTKYRYVALSYHRQDENRCELTIKERHDLLDCQHIFELERLPLIVRQTMRFVRELREKYLWVDVLCLAHGEDDVLHEMRYMNEIYAGALFTIIAACENGLYDSELQNASLEPNTDSTPTPNPPGAEVSSGMICRYEALFGSAWAKRGWTFQERMFSKRALVFVPKTSTNPDHQLRLIPQVSVITLEPHECFFWECELCMWDNAGLPLSTAMDLAQSRTAIDPKKHVPKETTDARQQFTTYLESVYHYNSRKFANPQDALRAFDGCLRKLREELPDTFRDGFECGLPRYLFHESLLWQPLGGVTRRRCRCENHLESPHDHLPSWSWCAWECALDLKSLHANDSEDQAYTEQSGLPAWKTKNPVRWEFLWSNGDLTVEGPTNVRPDGSNLPQQSDRPYLTCLTYTTKLRVRHVHQRIAPGRRHTARKALNVKVSVKVLAAALSLAPTRRIITLEDDNGTWAGVLGAMSADDGSAPNNDQMLPGQEVEWMAISEGSVCYEALERSYEESRDANGESASDDNPILRPHANYDDEYEFVNVLWIDRNGDRFSRRAVGRVEATLWRRLCEGKSQARIVLE